MGCSESKSQNESFCGNISFQKTENWRSKSSPEREWTDHDCHNSDFLCAIRAHYSSEEVQVDLNNSKKINKDSKGSVVKPSFDQDFKIGEFLPVEDENEGRVSRTKSFNPDEEWEKHKSRSCSLDRSEFNNEFIRQSYLRSQSDFNHKLKKGPSQSLRWSCWKAKLLNQGEFADFFQFDRDNLYEYLLCPFIQQKEEDQNHDSNINLIRKDSARTFPEFPYFEKIGKEQLERSLLASSNFFRNVGYCQGMNFIIGMLLMVSGGDESGAFQSFISLAFRKEFLLVGMYETGFPLLRLLELVFDELFRDNLPKLFKHFKTHDVSNTTWLTKWLMTLYLYSFPLHACVRIVDFMVSSNVFALVKVAVGVLRQLEHKLIQMEPGEVSELFSFKSAEELNDAGQPHPLACVNFEEVISEASRINISDSLIRQIAEECKLLVSREYSELIESLNKNDIETDQTIVAYTEELNNIVFFVEFFAHMGRHTHQNNYLAQIKHKFISSVVPLKKRKDS